MTQYRGAVKWALYMLALLAVGPLAAMPLAGLRDATGGHAATILTSTTLPTALFGTAVLFIAAAAMGLLAARLVGPRQALVTAGLVLFWGAWQTASLDALVRAARNSNVLIALSVESAILFALGLALAAMIWAVGGDPRRGGAIGQEPGAVDRAIDTVGPIAMLFKALRAGLGGSSTLAAILTAAVAGGLIVWLVAQEPLKGQCIAATVLGAIAAAGFGRALAARHAPPSPHPAIAALALLAIAAPIVALLTTGGGSKFVAGALQGNAFPLAMAMPLDWLAGAFWGVPIGLSWADSMTDKHETKD